MEMKGANLPAGLAGKARDLHAIGGPPGPGNHVAVRTGHRIALTRTTRKLDGEPLSHED